MAIFKSIKDNFLSLLRNKSGKVSLTGSHCSRRGSIDDCVEDHPIGDFVVALGIHALFIGLAAACYVCVAADHITKDVGKAYNRVKEDYRDYLKRGI